MERLRELLSKIGAQLGVLTISQRVAIGLCAAMIAGSLLWLVQWSTVPDLVPLVATPMPLEGLEVSETALQNEGVRFKTIGTRIFVHPDDKLNAIRVVHSAGGLPEGSLFDMAAAVNDQNPFQSPEARKYAQNYALGNELAKIIATSPFVKRASVLVNAQSKRRLGGRSYEPSAAVAIMLAPGKEMAPTVVKGVADLVSGAVPGLKAHNVKVTDSLTGRSHSVPHPDDAQGMDYLSLVKQHENHIASKIMSMLSDVPGLRASVTVELDTSKRTTQTVDHAPAEPKMESSRSSETAGGSQPSESGVQANLGQALTAGASSQTSTTDDSETEYFDPKLQKTETVEEMPFRVKGVMATVGIPRSFVAGVYAARYGKDDDVKDDDPDYIKVRDEQVARVKASVEKIVMAKSRDDVEVDVYPDMEWSADGGGWSRVPGGITAAFDSPGAMGSMELVRAYGPQVGLVALAGMSLLMMTRIVRKSADLAGAARARNNGIEDHPEEEMVLTVGPHAVGQAEVSGSMLTGKEVDEDTLRHQELGEEVARMVSADPKAAAELIRRWVGQEV